MSFTVPTLHTERLILRPWRREDAEDMFAYSSDPEVTRYAMWLPDATLEDTRKGIEEAIRRCAAEPWMYLGIELKEESKFIGSVGFTQWNGTDHRAELAFALNRHYWGRGIVTEAARTIIQFGWETMHLHRIEANCIAANAPSIAVLTKLGFEQEGLRKEAARVDGVYQDVIHWRKLRS
jgi:ribosomal-protein-alanine N-acetyltransferase